MSSRNTIRLDENHSYYHVYSRGVAKGNIFLDESDKEYFSYLLGRHLGKKQAISKQGYAYPSYRGKIEISAYCFMDNHVHFLVYQVETGALTALMRSVMTAYTMYFNRKYKRVGPLFQSRYKASKIDSDSYLLHISRYIHLNPRSWKRYKWSSYQHIFGDSGPEWLQPVKVAELFSSRSDYEKFVSDYEGMKESIDKIKHELANL